MGEDLGFRYAVRKNGDVQIRRHGRSVATLRGRAAERFVAKLAGADPSQQQQALARVTGNYKRGNERHAPK